MPPAALWSACVGLALGAASCASALDLSPLHTYAAAANAAPGDLFAIDTRRIESEREQFLAQVLAEVPDTVPADVHCNKIKRCDKNNVCAIVCERGSVAVDPWLQQTLALQRRLAYRRNFCTAQLLGTHNSAINLADGYGVEDHVFEGYLKYISWVKKGLHVHTNDQLFSLTDQLQMGIRFIELDVHWFNNDLHIAHCGGFSSKLLDGFVNALNAVAKLIGSEIQWDSETIGCSPSLSSIPASEQRPLNEALEEIATWLHAPENSQEFLMIFFDDETDLLRWKKVRTLLQYLKMHFNESEMFVPSDFTFGVEYPTFQELINLGKRIVFMSGTDYSPRGDEILFVKESICNWAEPSLPFESFPTCRFHHADVGPLDSNMTIFRPETSEIEYGFLNADGQIGKNKFVLDEKSLPALIGCGVNIPSPDNITPKRIEATVWALERDRSLQKGQCVGLTRGSLHWQSVDCKKANFVAACVSSVSTNHWQLGSPAVVEDEAESSCAALLPGGSMQYAAAASGYENQLVFAMLQRAPASVEGVWMNAKDLVGEIFSPMRSENQPNTKDQAAGNPTQVYDLLAVE